MKLALYFLGALLMAMAYSDNHRLHCRTGPPPNMIVAVMFWPVITVALVVANLGTVPNHPHCDRTGEKLT